MLRGSDWPEMASRGLYAAGNSLETMDDGVYVLDADSVPDEEDAVEEDAVEEEDAVLLRSEAESDGVIVVETLSRPDPDAVEMLSRPAEQGE
jgi:hypothetical protein